jgi:hypothetical protein
VEAEEEIMMTEMQGGRIVEERKETEAGAEIEAGGET